MCARPGAASDYSYLCVRCCEASRPHRRRFSWLTVRSSLRLFLAPRIWGHAADPTCCQHLLQAPFFLCKPFCLFSFPSLSLSPFASTSLLCLLLLACVADAMCACLVSPSSNSPSSSDIPSRLDGLCLFVRTPLPLDSPSSILFLHLCALSPFLR